MLRTDDYDLSKPNAIHRKKSDFDNRLLIINNTDAYLYLSIHINHLDDISYYGPQVFYDLNYSSNKELAQKIQNTFNKYLKGSRKIKLIPSKNYLYSKITIPGVLIECGFLSNREEREKLIDSSYQKKIAKLIALSLL